MPNSLLTGVSGLVAHQRLLDTVGHNIANMNTHGYKSQRLLFADSLYETINSASGGSDGGRGGTNPSQIGGGVKVANTDRNFSQGAMEQTGEDLDFAIAGDAFFTVTDGVSDFYTRTGAFSLDGDGYLVNSQGLYLKRFSNVGEPAGIEPGFQIPGDDRIRVPIGAPIPGIKSTKVTITGNLTGAAEGPRPQQLTAANPFVAGGIVADGNTLLNSIDSIIKPFADGDSVTIEGLTHNGSLVNAEIPVGSATTLQSLLDSINSLFPDSVASLQDGKLDLRANNAGNSSLSILLRNTPGNTGGITFPNHVPELTPGKGPHEEPTIVKFYDEAGGAHELKVVFRKQEDDIWSLDATIAADEGVVVDGSIDQIKFSDDGRRISTGDPTITVQLNGKAAPQTLVFDFGESSATAQLTHFASNSSLIPDADGAKPGELIGVQVDADGSIKGNASNGKVFTIAQLSIAKFRNNKGLTAEVDNLYSESLNSGQAEIGAAGSGGRGVIRGGHLESSNVDVANEFTKLIVAQRGFSANARTITIASEVLEELTNIIR